MSDSDPGVVIWVSSSDSSGEYATCAEDSFDLSDQDGDITRLIIALTIAENEADGTRLDVSIVGEMLIALPI